MTNKKILTLVSLLLVSFLLVGCFPTPTINQVPIITTETLPNATVGTAYIATVEATDADDDALAFLLVSGPTDMVISEAGVISGWTPAEVGTEDITVAVTDGTDSVSADFTITVSAAVVVPVAVTGVTLDKATLALTIGDAAVTLVETVEPVDATDPSVTWASSDESVAIVAAGVVTPLNAGISAITVTTIDGGFVATCVVTVTAAEEPPAETVAVTGVTLDKATLALTVGDAAVTLVATVAPEDATDTSVTWASSDEAVAIVTLGVVTPLNAGISAITATTVDGGFVATCVVTVAEADEPEPEPNQAPVITSAAINSGKVGVEYIYNVVATDPDGDDLDLTYSLTEKPLGMSIVAATGVIKWTPTDAGVFGVGVKVSDGELSDTQKFSVTVAAADEPAPEPELVLVGIVVDPKEMDLIFEGGLGTDTDTITSVTATYEIRGWDADIDLTKCTFLSSNREVATVKEVGGEVTVTAEGVGTADILVEYAGKFDTIAVTVIAVELDRISVNPSTMVLDKINSFSETIKSVTAYYNDGTWHSVALTDEDCDFSSNDNTIATVSDVGVVTIAENVHVDCETTITVSYEGKIDTIEVTVEITVIDIAAILGVTVPATDGVPVTEITETDQYTGTVVWDPVDDPFVVGEVYTATITLTPETGYTLTGVTEDFFTVAGTDPPATNAADSGIVTAVFPVTM